jgi:hypothetical protein
MKLILMYATYPRADVTGLPTSLAFIGGMDFGEGPVTIRPDGTMEQFGYVFNYSAEGEWISLSGKPVTPTAGRSFAFGKLPEGPILDANSVQIASAFVEDTNQNGKVDSGEPRLDF